MIREDAGVIELTAKVSNRDADLAAIDSIGRSVAGELDEAPVAIAPAVEQPSSPAIGTDEIRAAMVSLNQLQQEMDTLGTTKSSTGPVADARLMEALEKATAERARISERLSTLSQQLIAPAIRPDAIEVDSSRLKSMEETDAAYQADLTALRQREGYLTELLQKALAGARNHFDTLIKTTADGRTYIQQVQQKSVGQDVDAQLVTLNAVLAEWSEAAKKLQAVWEQEWSHMTDVDTKIDPISTLKALEPQVREFVDTTGAGMEKYRTALEAIGRGSDQLTTRLVLRNQLTLRLSPAVEARDEVVFATRSTLVSDDLEIAAMVKSVSGLRARVAQRREAFKTALRQEEMATARAEQDASLGKIRAERDALTLRASELDQEIVKYFQTIEKQIASAKPSETNASEDQRKAMEQEFAAVKRQLQQLEAKAAAASQVKPAQAPPAITAGRRVTYIPARIVALEPSEDQKVRQAAIIGGTPVAVGLVIGLLFAITGPMRRSRMPKKQHDLITESAGDETAD